MEKRVFDNENGNQFIAYEFDDLSGGRSVRDEDSADARNDSDVTRDEVD